MKNGVLRNALHLYGSAADLQAAVSPFYACSLHAPLALAEKIG
jgi:hypothetical protein